jgi:CubicO group peptidase (beta-lactamase class C family)
MLKKYIYTLLLCLLLPLSSVFSQNPGDTWLQYAVPEEAGWSSEKLEEARLFADSIGSAAFMVIHDGKVVVSWGEVERRFMCHSVRKSLLMALYGFYVDKGIIDIQTTIGELGIEDTHQLREDEKKATIQNLLQARSGIYHPAAYETDAMKAARPARGSHAPGTFWYYNNWDFNTSCHILMMHSRKDFFQDFKERIADPLGFQDFRLEDTYYHLEAENSQFPAYPFRLSARDMARFGQWFLQMGQWNGRQLISADWVKESAMTAYSDDVRQKGWQYAYMWWMNLYGDEHVNYSAQGVGNQAIIVYPNDNLVMINRTNTFVGDRVSNTNLRKLTEMVFAARTEETSEQPRVVQLPEQLDKYIGHFIIDGREVKITRVDGQLQAYTEGRGTYSLLPAGKHRFVVEDAQVMYEFQEGNHGLMKKEVSVIE